MIVRLISLYIVVLYIYNTVRINVVYQPIVRKTTLTWTTLPQKPDLPLKVSKPPQKPVLIMNNYRMSDKMKYSDKYFGPTKYKLDFTCGDIMCDYFKAIHRLKRPTSGEQYKPDFDVLFNVIKLHQKGHIIPKDSDIVMHLRLGDVANSKCWEGIGCHFEFSKKCYEHMHVPPPPGHIVVVSSNKHLSANHRESDEYKNKVVNFLRNKGYSVTDRHDHTEEEDVIFMFNAKQFIPGGGGFSDLVKQMAKKNGAKIIENWKHHCNDPPQKPDLPLKVSTIQKPDPSMLKPAIGMVAVTSSNMVEMTHNWWYHLKKYKIPTTLVSLSPNLCEQFNDLKCVYATHLKTDQRQQVDFGSSEYNYNVKHKLDEFSNIFDNTKDGDIILFSDVDVIYLSDPFHALPKDNGPLWFSDNNKKCNNRKDMINSGLFFVQKNDYTRNIFKQAKTALKDGKTYDGGDQGAFQTVLKNYKYSMLPCDTFINGAVFMNEKYNIHPVGIHLNWIAHSNNKISLMKKHGLWKNPTQKPIVHIFNANNGVGLGQIVKSIVPVLYTLRNENYTHFNIHECGLNPPWRNAVSCEIRPKHVALFNNFKRTRGQNDYTKLKDTNQMEYFDGQKNWYEFLTSPSKPNTKMILIENMHTRWRPHGFNDCDEIKYWFDEPVGHLLKLVQEPTQKIQTTITFHIRTFADERIGIAFNEDLTLNETLAKLERNNEKTNDGRIQRVIDMQTQFPNMIQKLVDIADFIYEKTEKITHVAADSKVVRKYLRKYPFIHIITPDVLDYNKHFKTEPLYSLNEIADWYLLSLGKNIAVFPSGSTFSGVAQCRGGGKTTYPHKTEDMDVIFDNIKRRFQKNIELHVLEKDADFGAGGYMEGAAKIYEIADAVGIPSTSIQSCGTRNKPWHDTATRCPKNGGHSAKRIKEMFKTLGPYQEIDDSKDFVHIDGQKQDWVKALQDLNPAKPTKVFLTQPHNKFITSKYHYENRNCKGKKKWFGESIFEFPANIQNNVSFHLRFLTHENLGVQISKNLSLHKVHRSSTMHDPRIDDQEINIPDVKQNVDIILQYADLMFKKTGKATFIATDSDNVRKYTRQYPYISIYNITHDNRDEHEIHFSKASMRDLYTLAQAKHIITFPFKSQFSATAACLGDGKQVVVHTLDKLKQELSIQ